MDPAVDIRVAGSQNIYRSSRRCDLVVPTAPELPTQPAIDSRQPAVDAGGGDAHALALLNDRYLNPRASYVTRHRADRPQQRVRGPSRDGTLWAAPRPAPRPQRGGAVSCAVQDAAAPPALGPAATYKTCSNPTVTRVRKDPVNTMCRTLFEASKGRKDDQALLQDAYNRSCRAR
jgi:hypothetical protein